MPFLITALVGFLVLPATVAAPMQVNAEQLATSTASNLHQAQASGSTKDAAPETAPSLTVKLTGYNAVPAQTKPDPSTTASGAYSNPEVVAARSDDLAEKLPFGTIVEIDRTAADSPMCGYGKVSQLIGYRVIADAMNPRITNTVDVLLNQNDTVAVDGEERNPAEALGLCTKVSVRVVGHVTINRIPKTQTQLAALVDSSTEVAVR